MENEIYDRVKNSMLEVIQAETERIYKNLAVPIQQIQSEQEKSAVKSQLPTEATTLKPPGLTKRVSMIEKKNSVV